MLKALQIWLVIFGATCALIGAAHFFGGQWTYIGGGEVNATMDSELRFYSLLFVAFGFTAIWAARDIRGRAKVIDVLSAVLILGGLGRLLAWAASGAPHAFFVAMIPVEILVGLAQLVAVRAVTREPQPGVPSSR
ncbi:hypothetical protein GOARA_090_00090 [Gordonia araii NBRC 100433]|uniref:DUF4345 domain-containing protein n=1 Tax=Gordonia araii NBRC 100433 TaxID=1073574 RepID=G7H7Q2_9ACTN|nr:DUF4345 domain-containing protein [Gordonia araii]NNG99111.1 DUF4345 domain-containing protein [Gordonia araii NBRC 100433]GAB11877.1 hypothetical protein GOARA_090_00090 [Gordonia araii NBRC 100433]